MDYFISVAGIREGNSYIPLGFAKADIYHLCPGKPHDIKGPAIGQIGQCDVTRACEVPGQPVTECKRQVVIGQQYRGLTVIDANRSKPLPCQLEFRIKVSYRTDIDSKSGRIRRCNKINIDIIAVVQDVNVDAGIRARIAQNGGGSLDNKALCYYIVT